MFKTFYDESVNCQDLIINGADIDLVSYTHEQNSGFHIFLWNFKEFNQILVQKRIIPQIGKNHGRKVNFSHQIMLPTYRIYSDILSCDATGILDNGGVMMLMIKCR